MSVAAAVLRDSCGKILSAVVERLPPGTPLEGEADTAYVGIKEASRLGCRAVLLDGDSLQTTKAIEKFPRSQPSMLP